MVSVEYSGLVITHLFHKIAVILTVFRWIFGWVVRKMGLETDLSHSSIDTHQHHTVGPSIPSATSSSSSSSCLLAPQSRPVSAQMIRDSLHVATYGEVSDRLLEASSTCAVCLNELRCKDKVWELRNCCHVFHKRCLDRWLDHDEHKTCPLCRAPLLGLPLGLGLASNEPSWAVEHLLYLFGDDLLTSSF